MDHHDQRLPASPARRGDRAGGTSTTPGPARAAAPSTGGSYDRGDLADVFGTDRVTRHGRIARTPASTGNRTCSVGPPQPAPTPWIGAGAGRGPAAPRASRLARGLLVGRRAAAQRRRPAEPRHDRRCWYWLASLPRPGLAGPLAAQRLRPAGIAMGTGRAVAGRRAPFTAGLGALLALRAVRPSYALAVRQPNARRLRRTTVDTTRPRRSTALAPAAGRARRLRRIRRRGAEPVDPNGHRDRQGRAAISTSATSPTTPRRAAPAGDRRPRCRWPTRYCTPMAGLPGARRRCASTTHTGER